MRAALALLGKEAREHALAALVLGAAALLLAWVTVGQGADAAFAMSPFESVRFALLTLVPLVALIVGGRLIVGEYLARTRLFVEALPLGQGMPLVLKYLLGLGYVASLTIALVLIAARAAGVADDATLDYVALMAAKSLAIATLYWSIAFCFSLCGHLRLLLYLITLALVLFVAWWPGIDASGFAPFALLDAQLFAFERDELPLAALAGTLALGAGFTLAGFVLVRVGEGSVAERLARPMTRRDHVAVGVLALTALVVGGALVERDEPADLSFTDANVLSAREGAASVSVRYAEPLWRDAGERLLARTVSSLIALADALGLDSLPRVRVALAPELRRHELDYSTADGVFVRADWLDHDAYDDAVLDAVVLHGALGLLSGERATFEPYHWVLDGVARWWSEGRIGGSDEARRAREAELLARAAHALGRGAGDLDLIDDWQLIADRFAYPTAEAVAWSAVRRIEMRVGAEAVLALARAYLGERVGGNSLDALDDRRRSPRARFERASGLAWEDFVADWRGWIGTRAAEPDVAAHLAAVPPLAGVARAGFDARGVYLLSGGYRAIEGATFEPGTLATGTRCVMKHAPLGVFDTEFEVDAEHDTRRRDVADCRPGEAVHEVGSRYGPGERVYVAFDVEFDREGRDAGAPLPFHQSLRLGAVRLDLRDEPIETLAGTLDGTLDAASIGADSP